MIPKVALFSLAKKVFALPVEGVEHIIETPRIFLLPRLRPGFHGVFLHQGEVIPYLDLSCSFGVKKKRVPEPSTFTVLFMTEYGPVGVPADQILQIVDRAVGKVESAPAEESNGGIKRYFVFSRVRYPLLDAEALLASLVDQDKPAPACPGSKEA